MKKIISIAKRLYNPEFKKFNPTECYGLLRSNEFPYNEYFRILSSEDILLLSYILPKVESGLDLNELCNRIKSNLFSFSYCEVEDTEPEEECNSCYGSGNEQCDNCDGTGNETCRQCDGDGKVSCDNCDGSGVDEEGDQCSDCNGSGEINCNQCDGDGNESCNQCGGGGEFDCYNCDGTGNVELNGKATVSQYFVISYNQKIKNLVELKEPYDEISQDFIREIYNDKMTLITSVENFTPDDDEFDSLLQGDYFFYEFSDVNNLGKVGGHYGNNKIYSLGLSDIA